MSLRLQLLAVGLLTLVLPWTGFRYVQEMETALRAGLEQSLLASAATVAAALEEQSATLVLAAGLRAAARRCATVYATALAREPELDGVRDDHWNTTDDAALDIGGGHQALGRHLRPVRLSVRRGRGSRSRLSAASRPDAVRRSHRALAAEAGVARWWLLNTAAPGAFRAQETGPEPLRAERGRTTDASSGRGRRRRAAIRSRCACR